jgi:hypothetical protein
VDGDGAKEFIAAKERRPERVGSGLLSAAGYELWKAWYETVFTA